MDRRIVELYDAYTHAPLPRRVFFDRLTRLAGAGRPGDEAALKASGKAYASHICEGANHAFNNDTSQARYNRAAAELAWGRTFAFFRRNLGA